MATGSTTKYSDLLKEAPVMKFSEIGIADIRCRRAIGSVLLVILGKENEGKSGGVEYLLKVSLLKQE